MARGCLVFKRKLTMKNARLAGASASPTASSSPKGRQWVLGAVAAAAAWAFPLAHAAADLSYLQGVRAATSAGGWSKVSTDLFSSAWAPAEQRDGSFMNPSTIVTAWGSMAWDSTQGQLMLWGGGHGNYMGNEMYLWSGATGTWSRGSLPSALTGAINITNTSLDGSNYFVADNAAPQSAHTYDNSVYLRQNNLYLTFGGASFNSGAGFLTYDAATDTTTRAGAWMWDPTKANGNLTGGISGSLVDQFTGGVTAGNEMWSNRAGALTTGSDLGSGNHVDGTTAYRVENGKDVVYLTMAGDSSGYRSLYRYEVGQNVRAGDLDSMTLVGNSSDLAPAGQATATIDTRYNLYVNTTAVAGYSADLGVWDLSAAALANGAANLNRAIELVLEDGTAFGMTTDFAIEYDEVRQKYVLWDARNQGQVWETEAAYDAAGSLLGTWVIRPLLSTSGLSQPSGALADGEAGATPFTGVLGKWKYVPELNVFLALNEFNTVTQDAEVWLYRPLDVAASTPVPTPTPGPGVGASSPTPAAVPIPGTTLLVLTGMAALGLHARRRAGR